MSCWVQGSVLRGLQSRLLQEGLPVPGLPLQWELQALQPGPEDRDGGLRVPGGLDRRELSVSR